MGRKKIRFTLNARSIRKAIIDVETYEYELERKIDTLMRMLADEGVKIAKMRVSQLGAVYTGGLKESIDGYYSRKNRVAIIRAGVYYAAYVEYGTGVVGATNPHPDPDGWVYDINEHGEEGWIYYNPKTERFHKTMGRESRPFMYQTARELERRCPSIVREVFGS